MNPVSRFGRASLLIPGVTTLTAVAQDPALPGFPVITLSQGGRGAGIVAGPGHRLPLVARWNELTEQRFGGPFVRDHDLPADQTGRLHDSCASPMARTAQNGGTEALPGNGNTATVSRRIVE